jgi:hypothetical protein
VAVAPSRRVLCLSSSLLSVGGGVDDLRVESTDPEKPLDEHDFNNFLNCLSFFTKKSQLKGISKIRIEPDGWSGNQWFAGFLQNRPICPVFTGLLAWAVLCA